MLNYLLKNKIDDIFDRYLIFRPSDLISRLTIERSCLESSRFCHLGCLRAIRLLLNVELQLYLIRVKIEEN
jgi:hypothetical protein